MMKKWLLSVCLLPSLTLAQTPPADRQQASCLNQAQTTAAMAACYSAAYQAWDTEMNQQYQRAMTTLEGESREKLRSAQRSWIAWRDSWLAAVHSVTASQGTAAAVVNGEQSVALVKNQAQLLQQLNQAGCANPDDCK